MNSRTNALSQLCDFEDDLELYRYSEGKARDADHDPNRQLLGAEDTSKQFRGRVRDSGVIEEIA